MSPECPAMGRLEGRFCLNGFLWSSASIPDSLQLGPGAPVCPTQESCSASRGESSPSKARREENKLCCMSWPGLQCTQACLRQFMTENHTAFCSQPSSGPKVGIFALLASLFPFLLYLLFVLFFISGFSLLLSPLLDRALSERRPGTLMSMSTVPWVISKSSQLSSPRASCSSSCSSGCL